MVEYDKKINRKKKILTAAGTGFFPVSMLAADLFTNELSDVCKMYIQCHKLYGELNATRQQVLRMH